jgi:hypothetical protein
MQMEEMNHQIVKGISKPLCFSQNEETIVVGEELNQMLLINKQNMEQYVRISTTKTDKTIGLKLTDKLLARAGIEGTVTLWDNRLLGSGSPIHTFNRNF